MKKNTFSLMAIVLLATTVLTGGLLVDHDKNKPSIFHDIGSICNQQLISTLDTTAMEFVILELYKLSEETFEPNLDIFQQKYKDLVKVKDELVAQVDKLKDLFEPTNLNKMKENFNKLRIMNQRKPIETDLGIKFPQTSPHKIDQTLLSQGKTLIEKFNNQVQQELEDVNRETVLQTFFFGPLDLAISSSKNLAPYEKELCQNVDYAYHLTELQVKSDPIIQNMSAQRQDVQDRFFKFVTQQKELSSIVKAPFYQRTDCNLDRIKNMIYFKLFANDQTPFQTTLPIYEEIIQPKTEFVPVELKVFKPETDKKILPYKQAFGIKQYIQTYLPKNKPSQPYFNDRFYSRLSQLDTNIGDLINRDSYILGFDSHFEDFDMPAYIQLRKLTHKFYSPEWPLYLETGVTLSKLQGYLNFLKDPTILNDKTVNQLKHYLMDIFNQCRLDDECNRLLVDTDEDPSLQGFKYNQTVQFKDNYGYFPNHLKILFVLLKNKQLQKQYEDMFSSDPTEPSLLNLQALTLYWTLGELDLLNRVVTREKEQRYVPVSTDPLFPIITGVQQSLLDNLKNDVLPVITNFHPVFNNEDMQNEFEGLKKLEIIKTIDNDLISFLKNVDQPDVEPSKQTYQKLGQIITSVYNQEIPAIEKIEQQHQKKRANLVEKVIKDKIKEMIQLDLDKTSNPEYLDHKIELYEQMIKDLLPPGAVNPQLKLNELPVEQRLGVWTKGLITEVVVNKLTSLNPSFKNYQRIAQKLTHQGTKTQSGLTIQEQKFREFIKFFSSAQDKQKNLKIAQLVEIDELFFFGEKDSRNTWLHTAKLDKKKAEDLKKEMDKKGPQATNKPFAQLYISTNNNLFRVLRAMKQIEIFKQLCEFFQLFERFPFEKEQKLQQHVLPVSHDQNAQNSKVFYQIHPSINQLVYDFYAQSLALRLAVTKDTQVYNSFDNLVEMVNKCIDITTEGQEIAEQTKTNCPLSADRYLMMDFFIKAYQSQVLELRGKQSVQKVDILEPFESPLNFGQKKLYYVNTYPIVLYLEYDNFDKTLLEVRCKDTLNLKEMTYKPIDQICLELRFYENIMTIHGMDSININSIDDAVRKQMVAFKPFLWNVVLFVQIMNQSAFDSIIHKSIDKSHDYSDLENGQKLVNQNGENIRNFYELIALNYKSKDKTSVLDWVPQYIRLAFKMNERQLPAMNEAVNQLIDTAQDYIYNDVTFNLWNQHVGVKQPVLMNIRYFLSFTSVAKYPQLINNYLKDQLFTVLHCNPYYDYTPNKEVPLHSQYEQELDQFLEKQKSNAQLSVKMQLQNQMILHMDHINAKVEEELEMGGDEGLSFDDYDLSQLEGDMYNENENENVLQNQVLEQKPKDNSKNDILGTNEKSVERNNYNLRLEQQKSNEVSDDEQQEAEDLQIATFFTVLDESTNKVLSQHKVATGTISRFKAQIVSEHERDQLIENFETFMANQEGQGAPTLKTSTEAHQKFRDQYKSILKPEQIAQIVKDAVEQEQKKPNPKTRKLLVF